MKNIKKIYAFSFFWMFLIIMPVIVPFFLSLGLSMKQVFQVQAIFGLSIVILEVPTGYLCDLWGRKNTLIIGSFICGIGCTYLMFVKSFTGLVIYEVILAISSSFVSGADISLLYDSVDKSERKEGTRSLANMQFYSMAGESIAAVLGGFLVTLSFGHVLVAYAIVQWIPFLIAFSFAEPVYEKMNKKTHWQNFGKILKYIFFNKDRVLILTFANLVIWGLASFFAVWMYQKYWQENNVSLAMFGIIWAAFNLSVGIMGKQVHMLEKKIGPAPLLIFVGLGPILGYWGMGVMGGYVGVAFGILFYLSRGINNVLLKDAMNWRIPSSFRATANSLHSMFFRLGFAVFGPGVGLLIDSQGMRFTLILLGCVFLGLFFLALVPLMKAIRQNA